MATISSIVYQPEALVYEERVGDYLRRAVSHIRLIAGHGLEGDQKAGRHPDRQVNLLSQEWLEARGQEGYRTAPGQFGEQIILAGLAVERLAPGTRLQLGPAGVPPGQPPAVIEITKPRTGCDRLALAQGKSIAGLGPIGALAKVIQGGEIRVGDPVTVLEPGAPEARQERYPPPGQRVDLGGRKLHLHSLGPETPPEGRPAVLFEAAIGDFSLTWALVHQQVAEFARALVYDRAGLGWSDPGPAPRDAQTAVDELRWLLQAAGVPGPYLLVGQSYAGLLVRLFAYQHPEEVAGILLLDAAHEDQFERYPQPVREMFGPLKQAQLEALRGMAETLAAQGPGAVPPLVAVPPAFPPGVAEQYGFLSVADPTRLRTSIAELEALEASLAQVRAARAAGLGEIPLVVLSHGQPAALPGLSEEVNQAYEAAWQQLQAELAALSRRSRRLVVEDSGHMIHHDRPEAVVEALREMILVTAAQAR